MERDAHGDTFGSDDSGSSDEAQAAQALNEHESGPGEVLKRVGAITRKLHDALSELGYDKALSSTVDRLPDARERLAYIARLTGDSAEKVLTTVEWARAVQDRLKLSASTLASTLDADAGDRANADADDRSDRNGAVRRFLDEVDVATTATNDHLTDIMIAQDFHDLTGQVVRKVVELAQTLEEQLVELLLEAAPRNARSASGAACTERLAGPVLDGDVRTDVVTNQSQVDDLLESLGF